ncbi:hypothetical protein [Bacillus sp. KH172YL63]|uniref:hypothetical protein n=1 Tax=Bacillus sp. KH172YL63 TaxID=2709784 RepID=UPI0013E4B4D7|nr:hypothetical protein [Bacillus sp. KH172YL63]BCB05454.1 hypothetical protein KH172YL63_35870 [Bacillus sp. KH172YL63]
MKNSNKLIALMTILPWFTIPLIGAKAFKRYLPGSIFMALFLLAEGRYAEKRKWWWFLYSVKPNVLGELPLIIGPFFVGTIWILKYTFGNFYLYLFVNVIVDSIFTYAGMNWFRKNGYVTLVRITKFQLSIVFLVKTIVLYGFQLVYEKLFCRQSIEGAEK